jgi:magnesium-transporting ATPase (P-type)
VLSARHFTGSTKDDKAYVTFDAVFSALVGIFQQAVTIIVVAIPEGLPLAVTLTLAFSTKRMVKENALVCSLSACECEMIVCTDKTRTPTLNQMKVTEFWVGTQQPKAAAEIAGSVVSLLCQGAGINSTGSVSPTEISRSPTEKALLSWAVADLGMDADALKRSCKVVHVEAFNSDTKRSGVMIRENATGALIAHWNGSAEMVLAHCSMYVDTEGTACQLGGEQRKKLEKVIDDMAVGSLRCIAFAYKQVDREQSKIDDEGLTLLGFVGLKDQDVDTVVTAARWQRCVYNNIQKFVQFQLSFNVAALVINFVSAITTGKMSVTTVELLWVNLIMETMNVLARETPTKAPMDRPPMGHTAPLISNAMWRSLAAQAFFQIAVLLDARGDGGGAGKVRLHQEAVGCLPRHRRPAMADRLGRQAHPHAVPDCPSDFETPEIVLDGDF